jgi:hypothetical protein
LLQSRLGSLHVGRGGAPLGGCQERGLPQALLERERARDGLGLQVLQERKGALLAEGRQRAELQRGACERRARAAGTVDVSVRARAALALVCARGVTSCVAQDGVTA